MAASVGETRWCVPTRQTSWLLPDGRHRLYHNGAFAGASHAVGPVVLTAPAAAPGDYTGYVARLAGGPLPTTPARPVAARLAVWPNPAAPGQAVQWEGANSPAAPRLFDALGRERALPPATGSRPPTRLTLPAALAPGVYVLRLGSQSAKIVVE